MSIRRYKFTVTDFTALQAAFPTAVAKKIIPEHVEYEAVYSIIAKLLDCGLTVPGIELAEEELPLPKVKRL